MREGADRAWAGFLWQAAREGGSLDPSRESWLAPLAAAVFVALTVLALPGAPLELNADTSWSTVLDHAHQRRLQFGSDIVFSYGPLGFLIAPYSLCPISPLKIVAVALISLTAAGGICLVAWSLKWFWRILLLWIFVFVATNIDLRMDLVLGTGLLCWGLLCFASSGRRLLVAVCGLAALACVLSLAKATLTLLAALTIVAVTVDLWVRGHRWLGWGLAIGFAAGFLAGWTSAGQALGHLKPFFFHTLAMVQGYNQGLGYEPAAPFVRPAFLVLLLAAALAAVRCLFAFASENRRTYWRRAVVFAWGLAMVLSFWKHGFVRGDIYHMVLFFGFIPVLALSLESLWCRSPAVNLAAGAMCLTLCVAVIWMVQSSWFVAPSRSLLQPFRAFAFNLGSLVRPSAYQRRMEQALAPTRVVADLPRLRRRVLASSVDVFGHNQLSALLNDLNYRPRPVFQTYAACNSQLMRLNERFYQSASAPAFVLFTLGSADRRFPPLEDALVLRHLMINYEPVDAEGPFLLLRTRSREAARLVLVREGAVAPGQRIDLEPNRATNLWLEICLEPTLRGQVRQVFYQPSMVRLAVWDGARRLNRLRAPANMLAAGFLASPLLLDNQSVMKLYAEGETVRPSAYSVEITPGHESEWRQPLRFRLYRVENRLGR